MKDTVATALTECADELVQNAAAERVTIFVGETSVNNEVLQAYVTLSRSKLKTGAVESSKKKVDSSDKSS